MESVQDPIESIYIYINLIKSVIDCLTRNVIYLINDNIKISSVGYTADNMKTRFAKNKRLCEVSKHLQII